MKNKLQTPAALILILCLAALTGAGCVKPAPEPDAPTAAPTFSPAPPPTFAPTPEPTPEPTQEPEKYAAVRAALEGMTYREKIGQLVMFGFWGRDGVEPGFAALMEKYPVGNIILGSGNIDKDDGSGGFDSARRIVDEIEEAYPCAVPRLFSADVEGGGVTRFKFEPALPSAYEQGKMEPDEVRELFEGVGSRLVSCGINMDLAPVFDISEDPLSSFLGDRIISSELGTVCAIGGAVTDGLHRGGCIACAKHFPGHGGTAEDSHTGTPVINRSAAELYDRDIAAFASAIEAGVDCIMAAHVIYPAFDEGDTASMSHIILTGLLRGELRFRGVIMTDDMLMEGLSSMYSPGEAALKFILAGGDMLLCSSDTAVQEEILLALYRAYETRIITDERLDESVSRILALKYDYGVWRP